MSIQDKIPADTARPLSPYFTYSDKELPDGMMDWRPQPVPAEAPDDEEVEEEVVPKDESAPTPVSSYESPTVIEPEEPVTPVPPVVEKDSGPPKVTSPGRPTSSKKPTTPGV